MLANHFHVSLVLLQPSAGFLLPDMGRSFRLLVLGNVCCDPDLTRCSLINLSPAVAIYVY